MKTNRKSWLVRSLQAAALGMGLWISSAEAQTSAVLVYDTGTSAFAFAAGDLRTALEGNDFTVTTTSPANINNQTAAVQVVITTVDAAVSGKPAVSGLQAQGYAIRRVTVGSSTRWWVIGKDEPGAMYGALELADTVKIDHNLNNVTNSQINPYLANRGIKFNIPLDVRTPSYSDDSSSAQANIPEMWSLVFWKRYLDQMARHHLNTLSLWNESPFPSLVRVPEYPNVALADVKRKVGSIVFGTGTGKQMYDPSWQVETLLTMTMDQKIAFWRQVMQYAKDRGVSIYIFTWNIYVYGTEPSGYGLTDSPSNNTTKDYFRRSVRTLFDTYPLLAGVGITVGENMPRRLTDDEQEQWAWDTYGRGVADAIANAQNPASPYYQPGRKIRLIHRMHQTDLGAIAAKFQTLPGYNDADSSFAFSYKYSVAHMYSSTSPLFIYQDGVLDTLPAGKKTWLTVRNDDMYTLRWGDPSFVRNYLTGLPDLSKIAGFYMGPDGYTWGREFINKNQNAPHEVILDKMWYSFLLWGRLAYDPTQPNSRFQGIVNARFPQVSGPDLFNGWASVSKIIPLVTRFFWGRLDVHWYPEASIVQDGAYATVQNFITPKWNPMDANEDGDTPLLMGVKDYVNGNAINGRLTPPQIADMLQQYADEGLLKIKGLSAGTNTELQLTLGDITAMAWLGHHYAEKIRGAVDLYRFQKNGGATDQQNAIVHLQTAATCWSRYAAAWSAQYVPQYLPRFNSTLDVVALQSAVNNDVPSQSSTLPTVSFSTPVNGQSFVSPANLSVTVNASQSGGSIANVKLSLNGVALTTDTSSPYTWTAASHPGLGNLAPGVYTLLAVATGNAGAINSSSIKVFVSGTANPPPPAPTGLTAAADATRITLNWTASAGATSYNVKRATASGGPYTIIGPSSDTLHRDSGVVSGTTYYYVISAVNASGESANSTQASATF